VPSGESRSAANLNCSVEKYGREYNIGTTDRSTNSRQEDNGFFAPAPALLVYNCSKDARSLFEETEASDLQAASV
jgi:hypothetical protein